MKLGGIGIPELLIILAVILLIFGPKNLPKLGSAVGKTVKNLREGMESAPDIELEDEGEDEPSDKKKTRKKAGHIEESKEERDEDGFDNDEAAADEKEESDRA